MAYATRADNVYLIDTQMFGFDLFQSSYLVAGDELALIDTGAPLSWDVVRGRIEQHGFALGEIAHIFITHAEHPDHSGNVGVLLKENDRAVVHVNPAGAEFLTNPEIEAETRRKNLTPAMAARFGVMEPVSAARLNLLADGDSVGLGQGVTLRAIFTPGHQPSGLVVFEEKYGGLFINDLCGASFADTGASWIFTPYRSDVRAAMEYLRQLKELPVKRLYLGHFGISDSPAEVLDCALAKMQGLLDIGARCVGEGQPGEIEAKVLATLLPELEKMGTVRGRDGLYSYLDHELIPSLAKAFAGYYKQSL